MGFERLGLAVYNFILYSMLFHQMVSPKVFSSSFFTSIVLNHESTEQKQSAVDYRSLSESEVVDLSRCFAKIDLRIINVKE